MSAPPKPPLISERVLLIGDERIPRGLVETLSDAQLHAFLRERDPRRWPAGMEGLIEFLSEEERMQALLAPILLRCGPLIRVALHEWVRRVRAEHRVSAPSRMGDEGLFVEEIKRFLGGEVLSALSEKREPED